LKLRISLTVLVGLILAAPVVWWALKPIPHSSDGRSSLEAQPEIPGSRETTDDIERLDAASFAVVLWNPPPPPDPGTQHAKPEPVRQLAPPQVELVAIIEAEDGRQAALYHRPSDELRVLGVGDAIDEYTIASIDAGRVEFAAGSTRHTLALITASPLDPALFQPVSTGRSQQ
jgi:hypothetical protein